MKQAGTDSSQDKTAIAILEARARALARPAPQKNAEETAELLLFRLAYETYGIETAFVREVYPLKELTPLPCVPPFVAGIVNVRGQVLSVIDLKYFFQLPGQGISDLNKVIILSNSDMEFGILADAILEVCSVASSEMQAGMATLTGVREQYLKGIMPEGHVVLDALKLLTDSRIVVREEV